MRWLILVLIVLASCSQKKASPQGEGAAGAQAAAGAQGAAEAQGACEGAACETRCRQKRDAEACARSADLFFDGQNGHPLDMKKSFELAVAACDGGAVHGCTRLGFHYQDGLGAEWNPAKAVEIYKKACAKGAGTSCYNLAGMYLGGHGVTVDFAEGDRYKALATRAWETACKGSEPRWCTNAAFALGADAYDKRLEYNKRACDDGTLVGCTQMVGDQFMLKQIESPTWRAELEKLCARGEPTACSMAAAALRGPSVPPEDLARRPTLLERGCDIGDTQSCMLLAVEPGTDAKRRLALLTRACDRASRAACLEIAREHLASKRVDEAVKLSIRACKMGELEGCAAASHFISTGNGVAANAEEGLKWATEACRLHHPQSCGFLVSRDRDLPMPLEAKRKLLTQACEAKVSTSCDRLAALPAP